MIQSRLFSLAAVAAATLALSACGGGGSDPAPAADAPVVVQPATLKIGGTAATGAAIAAGSVEIKCATGAGTTTTAANGTYNVEFAGTLPCVIRVSDGVNTLHSLLPAQAAAPTAALVANVTPLTDVLVANVSGGEPSALFANFSATAQADLTGPKVDAAVSTLLAAMQGTIDLAGVNPLTDTLVAANGSTPGNALDQLLDALRDALVASQVTLSDLRAALIKAPEAQAEPILGTIAPPATSCPALKSGTYVVMNPHETNNDQAYASHLIRIDAPALTLTDLQSKEKVSIVEVPGQPCAFTGKGEFGTDTFYASAGGMIVLNTPAESGALRTAFIAPVQTIALDKLAGDWNFMAFTRPGVQVGADQDARLLSTAPLQAANGSFSLDAAGKMTAITECTRLVCAPASTTDLPAFSRRELGGYVVTETDGSVERAFPVVSAEGGITLFILSPNEEGMTIATKKKVLPARVVGEVNKFYDFQVGRGNFRFFTALGAGVSGFLDTTTTITAFDAATNTYTRVRASDGRVDTFVNNNPRNGLRFRALGPTVLGDGTAASVSESLSMPLSGQGLSVYQTTGGNGVTNMGVSINHP